MELSIIIVNWHSAEFVRQCLRSIQAHAPSPQPEIIVVDGGSYDGCGEMMAREFPEATFIQSTKNLGFARANNLGAKQAHGRVLWFLNPDTELLEDSISILQSRLRSLPEAGAVGCRLLNSDRTLQTSCIQSFPTVLNQVLDSDFLRARFPRSSMWGMAALYSDRPGPEVVEVVSGACIMVRRSLFEEIGGFTQDYFMYGEDLDLCFKIRQAGCRVYFVPETSVVHHGGGSTQKAASNFSHVMTQESVYRFFCRNRGRASGTAYRLAMAVTAVPRLLACLPLLLISGNRIVRHGTGSLRKWLSILRWSLGLESWTKTYGQ
jgi:GT2 family glycosyltransferase